MSTAGIFPLTKRGMARHNQQCRSRQRLPNPSFRESTMRRLLVLLLLVSPLCAQAPQQQQQQEQTQAPASGTTDAKLSAAEMKVNQGKARDLLQVAESEA